MESRARARPWFDRWMEEGQRKVVVKAPDLKTLGLLKEQAIGEGIVAVMVQDAGLTEVEPGTVTVLGIGPAPDEAVDVVTGHLSLY
jgi:PTH2 family peptidyl-tRNA hydrolase